MVINITPPKHLLKNKVINGVGWNTIGALGNKIAVLIGGIFIARLLSPKDYAIAGLAGGVMMVFSFINSQGFNAAIIREKKLTDSMIHSVFWFLSSAGIAGSIFIIITTPLISKFYENHYLQKVLIVLAINLAISMISSVPMAILFRNMKFRELNTIELIISILSALLGVCLAWLSFAYWALIIPILIASSIRLFAVFYLTSYRPAFIFKWNEIRSISKLGFTMMGNRVLRELTKNGDSLIMPIFWVDQIFGLYYFALQRSRQIFSLINAQLSNVFLPAFSQIQEDKNRIKRGYLKSTKMLCLVIYPLCIWLISVADIIIPLLFGDQWSDVVPVFRVFVAFGFMNTIVMIVPDVMNANNQPMKNLFFNIFRIIVVFPALFFSGTFGLTIFQVSVILFTIWNVQVSIYIVYIYSYMGISMKEFSNSVGIVVMGSVVMGSASILCDYWASSISIPNYLELLLVTIVPAMIYTIVNYKPIKDLMMVIKIFQIKTAAL